MIFVNYVNTLTLFFSTTTHIIHFNCCYKWQNYNEVAHVRREMIHTSVRQHYYYFIERERYSAVSMQSILNCIWRNSHKVVVMGITSFYWW
jgi:hypothetical protein